MLRGFAFGLSGAAAAVGSRSGVSRVDRQCRAHYWNADCFWFCLSGGEGAPNRAAAELVHSDAGLGVHVGHDWRYFTRAPADFVDLLACCDLTRQKAVPADARMGVASAIQMGSCRGAGVFDDCRSDCV